MINEIIIIYSFSMAVLQYSVTAPFSEKIQIGSIYTGTTRSQHTLCLTETITETHPVCFHQLHENLFISASSAPTMKRKSLLVRSELLTVFNSLSEN